MDNQSEIDKKLEKIKSVFALNEILMKNINQEHIKKYYNINKIPYSIFHTKKDFIHMGIRKGGIFIIFDGYQNKNSLSENERIALKLTEVGMAVEKFESYNSFLSKVKKNKFKIILEEDASNYVLPTMNRFERIAKIFFN